MPKNRFLLSAALAPALFLNTALVSAEASNDELGFHGSGEAGFNQKTGNVNSESLLARLSINYSQIQNDYKGLLEIENKTEQDVKVSERYVLDLQADRYFTEDKNYYAFVNARGEQDEIAGLDQDVSLTLGLGKVLYRTSQTRLSTELGLGYQEVDYVNDSENDFNQTTGRAKLDFSHKFNDNVRFVQDLTYFTGAEQYKTESHSSLRVALNSKLSVSTSYKYRYNSNPADAAKKTDTETSLSLIYSF
ncbi:MAG: DUF481 domain-containing protein [Thiomicrospira sp.]|uniref:DUF481 domain-containing protein n=1 Tax=Thiomicrospira sp. TaxID=935 RepID=UPI0019D8A2AE|nr:DUF481 domain-containing protein [Thiomicrospira sp.]MBE0493220.1 DUF481 domain-containing protein [Thiomicrospira sp.]